MHRMVLSIASGKGGTGKTTIATNLALAARDSGLGVQFLDCDVEEPNAHIFLTPDYESLNKSFINVPDPDLGKCTKCGKCAEVCQFRAITLLADTLIVFPELCHGCGSCMHFCPEDAISQTGRETGVIERGTAKEFKFAHGRLRIGEAMSPPLIREVKKYSGKEELTIIDAPPGTSCPVIASISGSDYVVLVTEPTPFGLNDLEIAVGMTREMGLPFGVVINRSGKTDSSVRNFCDMEGIEILAGIPDSREAAEVYSRGGMLYEELPAFKECFSGLFVKLKEKLETAADSRSR